MTVGISNPDWAVPVFEEALELDWKEDGDEWLHHLMTSLAEDVPMTGHGRSLRTERDGLPYPPHYEIQATSDELRSSLRVVLLEKGLFLFVTGEGEPAPGQIYPWIRAVQAARESLGKRLDAFPWYAIVGPAPGIDETVAIECADVGPLRLEPTRRHYLEFIPTAMPSLSARQGFGWWPVIVYGESVGFDWFRAGQLAARDLRRLCGLLSIATKRAWTLRQAPAHPVPDRIELPAVAPGLPDNDPVIPDAPGKTVSVPEWASEAWSRLGEDPDLEGVLSSHLEGLLMEGSHPSFAMVAFVGAIETLGARVTAETSSRKRFEAALSKVVAAEEAKRLADAYGRRSATAHAGRLYGSEAVFDFMSYPSMFLPDPAFQFAFGELRKIRDASSSLLELALTAALPWRGNQGATQLTETSRGPSELEEP